MPSASSDVRLCTRAISRLISWTSSSSSCRKIWLEASSPIITMRIAALRKPGICSASLPLIFTIEPTPDHVRHGGGVLPGLRHNVLGQYFGLLSALDRQFESHQRLG